MPKIKLKSGKTKRYPYTKKGKTQAEKDLKKYEKELDTVEKRSPETDMPHGMYKESMTIKGSAPKKKYKKKKKVKKKGY